MMNCISTFEIKKRLNTQRILIVPCGWDQLSGKNSLWKKWISNIFLNTIFFSSGVFFVSEVPSEVRSPEWEWCSWWKVYLITGTGQGSVWAGGGKSHGWLSCSYFASPALSGCSLVCAQDHIKCCCAGGMGSFLITSSCLVACTNLVLVEPGGPCVLVPPVAQEAFRSACSSFLA